MTVVQATNNIDESTYKEDILPLITVILTLHIKDNPEYFILAARSILDQTYPNVELLIVADGEITKQQKDYIQFLTNNYSVDHGKIIRFLKLAQCSGPAKARNFGIRESKGSFIAIMDSDDVSKPDRLVAQYTLLRANALDVISSNYIEINSSGVEIGRKHMPLTHKEIKSVCPFICPLNNPAVFAKKEALSHGYRESVRFGEDYRLWIDLLKKGYKFGNHEDYLLEYRENESFVNRRRGFSRGWSDFVSKTQAMPLVSFYKRPIVLAFAIVTFIVRLFPPALIRQVYSMRRKLNFSKNRAIA